MAFILCSAGCVQQSPTARQIPEAETVSLPRVEPSALTPEQNEVGDVINNSLGMTFVPIPPGRFLMGSPESDVFRMEEEIPHEVELTQPLHMGVFTVTQEQYARVMQPDSPDTRLDAQEAHIYPVQNVSWDDAVDFCDRLSELPAEKEAGHCYRLPTEAEWEYACRAGTTTAYSCGNDELALRDYAWFHDNANRRTHPVGRKQPNPWCLYDMHGNVFQWCQDVYVDYQDLPAIDPVGRGNKTVRVARGGSWYCPSAQLVRSAFRHAFDRDTRTDYIGFRIVLLQADDSATMNDEQSTAVEKHNARKSVASGNST